MNVLRFRDRSTGATLEGRELIGIDNRLCESLGVEPDPQDFYHHWIDRLGLRLALGQSYAECREGFKNSPDMLQVLDFLEKNFEADCYYTR